MNQLDRATQQNAAMFEETSATTTVLNSKTRELVASIRRFTFGETDEDLKRAGWSA